MQWFVSCCVHSIVLRFICIGTFVQIYVVGLFWNRILTHSSEYPSLFFHSPRIFGLSWGKKNKVPSIQIAESKSLKIIGLEKNFFKLFWHKCSLIMENNLQICIFKIMNVYETIENIQHTNVLNTFWHLLLYHL